LDKNLPPGSNYDLIYKWSCLVASSKNYGSVCDYIFKNSGIPSTFEQKKITVNGLLEGYIYQVTLVVSTFDGRTSSNSITIEPAPPGAPEVSTESSLVKINYNSRLVLTGTISAYNSQYATWAFDELSIDLNEISLTPTSKEFNEADIKYAVSYPISIAPFSLLPQKTYTFSLVSCPISNSSLCSYSSIRVLINSPPSPGIFKVSPSEGKALTTRFTAVQSFWTDDLSDYPLTYQFEYSLGLDSDPMMLTSYSEKTSSTFELPAGLLSQEYNVTCKGSISDSYGAFNEIYTPVKGYFFPSKF